MEYIEEHYEKINVKDIKNKFGENGWHLFSRYCIGTKEDYATSVSNRDGTTIYNLTGAGIRKLHELRKILAEENRAEYQKNVNMIIAFTGSALAFIGAINLFEKVVTMDNIGKIITVIILSIILGISGLFLVINFVRILRNLKRWHHQLTGVFIVDILGWGL